MSVELSKISLNKPGERAKIDLSKGKLKDIKVTLRWTSGVDLDLHAFYKTKAGAFGQIYFANKGHVGTSPYIQLDQDAGVGNTAGQNEENLMIGRLDDVEYVVIATNIFRFFGFLSGGENFAQYDGSVLVQTNNDQEFTVPLVSKEKGKWCIISKIDNRNPAEPAVENLNRVQKKPPVIEEFA